MSFGGPKTKALLPKLTSIMTSDDSYKSKMDKIYSTGIASKNSSSPHLESMVATFDPSPQLMERVSNMGR